MLNTSSLAAKLEAARAAKHSLIPTFKQALLENRQIQAQRFFALDNIEDLLTGRADFVDEVLGLAWLEFDWQTTPLALIAVGGYGRGELHPHSDIDLLILIEGEDYTLHQENIQSFIALLWDIGLEVGHSIRSVSETQSQAKADITVITTLIDGRPLCGKFALFTQVQALITTALMWDQETFFTAKTTEQKIRHRKFAHTAYSLEPNVKTSPGGLRDIQTVMWVARRQFGEVSFNKLVDLNFLTPSERDILRLGERKLWKIRFALHIISGKDENRLLFEHQRKLAAIFKYEDGAQLAVEQFMQSYYRAALAVNTTSELLLQHFEEAFTRLAMKSTVTPIDNKFQIRNHRLEVTHGAIFKQYPAALLEVFLHIGTHQDIKRASTNTIRLIRSHLHLIDDNFRRDPEVTRLFIRLLRTSEKLSSQLILMKRHGILGAYLPEFGRVIGQMQFDLFHIYTVDTHTLEVVRNMRRFRHKNEAQRFPVAAHIYPRLPKIELLFIAGLYHDIAKGLGGDHSMLGVNIARQFCKRHHLTRRDTDLVCWLVENHLCMSGTAQRKDISNPEVIHRFALLVQDQVRLDYLYALTVADINATNPTLWNSWRASLMRQLYNETKKALRHGLRHHIDRAEYITANQNEVMDRLIEQGFNQARILQIWKSVDDDYFTRESSTDILWHTHAIARHNLDAGPLILIRDTSRRRYNEGATQIFIYTHESANLFAAMVSTIDQLGLSVLDAKIASSDRGLVFDTFTVLETEGMPVGDNAARQGAIRRTITRSLNKLDIPIAPMQRRTPRALKPFQFHTEVNARPANKGGATLLEVITPDRQGLLSIIANIFVEMKIQLHSAKITTLGERVEDVFFITNSAGQAISNITPVCQRISSALDQHISRVSH